MTNQTHMYREIREIPGVVTDLLSDGHATIKDVADNLRCKDIKFICTVARGSSDHAATYFKYAAELTLGLPVASIGPSIASIYKQKLQLANSVCISISQSGQSPDIVEMARSAAVQGALTIAITNEPDSALARVSNQTIAIHAGIEQSVAATKTFVTSAVAGLALLAHWKRDDALISAIERLPQHMESALSYDWPALRDTLKDRGSLFVLGRGPSYAMACEAALKFKETCGIHAEAYSSAELLHGPVSIIKTGYPVLALVTRDASEPSIISVADALAKQGASVFATTDSTQLANRLKFSTTSHPLTDPLALIVSFYAFIERLAVESGINPDMPPNLKKVTETV
ncbi:MAG: SIS domain-containing protein [Devosiaceae bacterium]|nr:SIS domain-containing protein [Devosiaceae bacterium]